MEERHRRRGAPELQDWIRSNLYALRSSIRAGDDNSIAPAGLSSDNYAGLIFWDAETWMYPSLLAFHPDVAESVVEYRRKTLPGGPRRTRVEYGYQGLFFPWNSAGTGDLDECHSWDPPHCLTQIHLQGDIALSVWQYYLATGDTAWLRSHWTLLQGIAEFWAGRVTANADGSYSINNVAGPDEYSNGVNDGVFTNAGAAIALRNATRAAAILGEPAPAQWTVIADHLRMPFDDQNQVFLQYDGYQGTQIKQADTVLLLYPLEWPMSTQVAANTLDYYAPRTDPDGPAMTDAIHAVDAAQIGEPGCATHTYLMRSIRPFVRDPFAQFTEARGDKAGAQDPLAGSPAYNFLTGSGGFSQVVHVRPHGAALARGPRPPRPDAAAAAVGRRDAQGPALARADVRRRDRRDHDDGHAAQRQRVHARVAGRDADRERVRDDPDPPARPRADGQPRPLPARHRELRGGRASTPRRRSTAARRRSGRRRRARRASRSTSAR